MKEMINPDEAYVGMRIKICLPNWWLQNGRHPNGQTWYKGKIKALCYSKIDGKLAAITVNCLKHKNRREMYMGGDDRVQIFKGKDGRFAIYKTRRNR